MIFFQPWLAQKVYSWCTCISMHFIIVTKILQRFFDKFCREAEIVRQLQTWRLYSPVGIGVTSEVCGSIGTQTVSWQLLFH